MEKKLVAKKTKVIAVKQNSTGKNISWTRRKEARTTTTRLKKGRKRVLMFAKLGAEKVSSTEFQSIEKEQKQNSEVCKIEC